MDDDKSLHLETQTRDTLDETKIDDNWSKSQIESLGGCCMYAVLLITCTPCRMVDREVDHPAVDLRVELDFFSFHILWHSVLLVYSSRV